MTGLPATFLVAFLGLFAALWALELAAMFLRRAINSDTPGSGGA